MKKIVYGICGIGNGHLFRQLPILTHLLNCGHKIIIFTYGTAYEFFNNQYIPKLSLEEKEHLKIVKVDVPYFIGNHDGLDFIKSSQINSLSMNNNLQAFATAQEYIGKPDLIISDYEPFSAQYGYAYSAPVITIDQQSKYLLNSLPLDLNGFNYQDEIMRLNMFFPKTEKRIACSFFNVPMIDKTNINIISPTIRSDIVHIRNKPDKENPHYIVYISAQDGFKQNINEIFTILSQQLVKFTIFIKESELIKNEEMINNFLLHNKQCAVLLHGNKNFEELLKTCSGIITTAGHTLLSEAMYLNIPVYAMPLGLYEQQLNAHIIGKNNFGINFPIIEKDQLQLFINNSEQYRQNIQADKIVLKKDNGLPELIIKINNLLSK